MKKKKKRQITKLAVELRPQRRLLRGLFDGEGARRGISGFAGKVLLPDRAARAGLQGGTNPAGAVGSDPEVPLRPACPCRREWSADKDGWTDGAAG